MCVFDFPFPPSAPSGGVTLVYIMMRGCARARAVAGHAQERVIRVRACRVGQHETGEKARPVARQRKGAPIILGQKRGLRNWRFPFSPSPRLGKAIIPFVNSISILPLPFPSPPGPIIIALRARARVHFPDTFLGQRANTALNFPSLVGQTSNRPHLQSDMQAMATVGKWLRLVFRCRFFLSTRAGLSKMTL